VLQQKNRDTSRHSHQNGYHQNTQFNPDFHIFSPLVREFAINTRKITK
jgi:hypothetical protein